MRLTFPNGEHAEVIEPGRITLGSGNGNRVRIDGLTEHHAVLANDRRGLWLVIENNDANAHVNARPVSRLALVRPGDLISLGRVQMLLRGDIDPQSSKIPPASGAFHSSQTPDDPLCAARFVLRGVGGMYSGCSFNLCDPLLIGRGADAQIRLDEPALAEQHARVELHGDRMILRDLAGEGTLVNGVRVKDVLLNSGDQLAFEQHRFVVEAPGLKAPTRRHDATPPPPIPNNTQTMRAVPVASTPGKAANASAPADANAQSSNAQSPKAGSGATAWWLILAAAALGTAITLLLIYAPRLGG
jgi:hypothetical protein